MAMLTNVSGASSIGSAILGFRFSKNIILLADWIPFWRFGAKVKALATEIVAKINACDTLWKKCYMK